MVSLWNFYLNFSVKARLATLCVCYSACIAATALAAQADSALIKYGSVILFIVLGVSSAGSTSGPSTGRSRGQSVICKPWRVVT